MNRNHVKKREIFLKELFDLLKEILGINLPEGKLNFLQGIYLSEEASFFPRERREFIRVSFLKKN